MKRKQQAAALALFGFLLTLLAYLPALEAGFFFDDEENIVRPPGVHWHSLSFENLEMLVSSTLMPRRVVANLSLALNHLFGGLDPRGYHVVNLLIHLAVGVALAWVSTLYLLQGSSAERRRSALVAALVSTTLFLVHPLGTQAVTYVVQRMTSLATLFCLLAFGCYLRGRHSPRRTPRPIWFGAGLVAWLLALGSKEIALALPLVVVSYELCFHRAEWRRWFRRFALIQARKNVAAVVGLSLLLGAGSALLYSYVDASTISILKPFPNRDFNGLERVLTQPRVQTLYAGLLAWPHPDRLSLEHDVAVSRGLLDPPSTLPSVLFWSAATCAILWLALRRPRFGFPLLAYLELHLLESGPLNLEVVFEHRMYMPMTALVLFVATMLYALPRKRRVLGVSVALLCALPLTAATYARNLVWADAIAFHRDCARKSPAKFRPHYNLGTELGRRGRVSESLGPLQRAVALDPGHSEAHNQLGNALLMTGREEEALERYRRAVELRPGNAEALYNLAMLLERRGEITAAMEHYRRFVDVAPPYLSEQVVDVRARLDWHRRFLDGSREAGRAPAQEARP